MKTPLMRLDEALKSKGLVSSREKAKALILEGHVKVDGLVITKPSFQVEDEVIDVLNEMYVSRSALKLKEALENWHLDIRGHVILDIGASTGGFTEVALEKGAAKICALDVGSGQLAETLRTDPRVINLENIHFLKTRKEDFAAFDTTVIDVSFISSLKILKHAIAILDCRQYLVLFKPQFESETPQKDHLVKPRKRLELQSKWLDEVKKMGFSVLNSIDVTPGKKGNQETMMHLKVKDA